MITTNCFKREWIEAKRSELGGGDPTLIEKTIHAFALLGHLARRGVPMVFKGGTSLILRLPEIKRLSIDIDILCPLPDQELDSILSEIATQPPFVRHEEDDRGHHRMPARRHFKFYYAPTDRTALYPHVLLDVVSEDPMHPHADEIIISSSLFEIEEEVRVVVPTVENLLGDKLTALAPDTVGIPCTPNYAMQIMKQLFDIEVLFDASTDFEKVALAYDAIFRAENSYRGGQFSAVQTLNDTIETARLICHFNLKGSAENERQALFEQGRKALDSHLIRGPFSQAKAKVAASKAAFLASCLMDGKATTIKTCVPYDTTMAPSLKDVVLTDAVLHRLRGGNAEAFYYWALTLGKIGGGDKMHKYTKLKFDEAKVRYSKERNMEWSKRYSTGRNSTYGVLSFIAIGQEYIAKLLNELFDAEKTALLKETDGQPDSYFSNLENEITALIEKEYDEIFNEIEKQHKIYGPDLIARKGQQEKSSTIESIHRKTQILQEDLRVKIPTPLSSTTIHVTGDVGVINTGKVHGNIQVKLEQMRHSEMNAVADAFEKVAAAISESSIIEQDRIKQMQNLDFLMSQCQIPKEERNDGVADVVVTALSVAANLSSVWANVGPQIMKSLGLPS